MIHATPSDPTDAFELHLREEDAREVSAAWRQALALAILEGGCLSYRDPEGALVGIFGLSQDGQECCIWLLCSSLVEKHKAAVWRAGKQQVEMARARGCLVYNFIPKDSPRNRAFVAALGFRLLPSPRDGFDFFYLPHV